MSVHVAAIICSSEVRVNSAVSPSWPRAHSSSCRHPGNVFILTISPSCGASLIPPSEFSSEVYFLSLQVESYCPKENGFLTFSQIVRSVLCCANSLGLSLPLCDAMDCSPPGSSVYGILQARILGGLPCPLPRDLPDPQIKPVCLCIGRWVLYHQCHPGGPTVTSTRNKKHEL